MLERGREFTPMFRADLDAVVVDALVRLARLSDVIAGELRDCPEPAVRRAAAVLAARGHPILAGLGD